MIEGIHIVSFDVPFPPDYGGVIDVYYKVKALAKEGVKVKLHCFDYGRRQKNGSKPSGVEVIYYDRKLSAGSLLSKIPFIVKTRKSQDLLDNLLSDNWPILLEGLHTCAWLDDDRLKDRYKMVRAHNIEHDYYRRLAKSENSIFRKQYFKAEAKKLKSFEKILAHSQSILAISQSDQAYFEKKYGKSALIYPFHQELKKVKPKRGNYAFYHGNLEVAENQKALKFLIEEVFGKLSIPLVVAGKGSENELSNFAENSGNVKFHLNPSEKEMTRLALNAAVHVLPAAQATGFKLKLLHSLQSHSEVIANKAMVTNTGLEDWVTLAETASAFRKAVVSALEKPIEEGKIKERHAFLQKHYSNSAQAKKIIDLMP
jgi:hypothetical protein